MKIAGFFFVLILGCYHCFAAGDSILVHKDSRIDILTKKQILWNKHAALLNSTGQYKGFRIQVSSSSSRDYAMKLRADLLSKYQDQKSYVVFISPSYKVRIGNFLKREDAEIFKKQIADYFDQGIYIVEDLIEYTPNEEEISQQTP